MLYHIISDVIWTESVAPCITLVPEAAPGRGQLQAIILFGQNCQESHEDQLQQ